MKAPKAPKPTAEETALVARQSRQVDEETEQLEKRLKAQARGKLGSKSLLAKGGKKASGASGRSMMGGSYGGTSGGGAGSSGSGSGSGGFTGSSFNRK